MSDHRPAQQCRSEHPYSWQSEVCSWPYCNCLRQGQERQGLRYKDVKRDDAASHQEEK